VAHTSKDSHKLGFSLHLGERGRIVLPAELRRRLALEVGDRLILTLEPDGSLRLVAARELAQQALGLFAEAAPSRELAAELIAERKAEAARD
jgi:AbrB family looped-hinge helix DNA binding protein